MKALVYGTRPDPWDSPDSNNKLLNGLARVPMQLQEIEVPGLVRDDWVIARTRLAGICGSDAKQVFMDFGDDYRDSALNHLFTFPTVLGHEVVADVIECGPGVTTISPGQRFVLNPWLSCAPRGITPVCGACAEGNFSQCWNFTEGLAAGIHTGTSKDAPGGFADYFPAHQSMCIPIPDNISDEIAVLGDPFAVSLHSVTRHPPGAGGKALVYGAGALGLCAIAALRALYPEVQIMAVARFGAQRTLAESFGAVVVDPDPRHVIEAAAAWSGGVLQPAGPDALPMAHPGGIDVVYDTIGTAETSEVAVRVLKSHGTLVKSGVHAPARWEWSPLYFKEVSWVGSNAFGIEEVEGRRAHGISHYLQLCQDGRVDLTGMLTHLFALSDWRAAFTALATQEESGAVKVAFDFRADPPTS